MSSNSPYLKEALGFKEGEDVFVYLVDGSEAEAELLGNLRPEFSGNGQRLYGLFELQLKTSDDKSVYFGQKSEPPFIITLTEQRDEDDRLEYVGQLETNLFQAQARLAEYSHYSQERYTLTVTVVRQDTHRRGPMDQVLPEAWRKHASSEPKSDTQTS